MIREFLEKRRIRKAFSSYLSPTVIDKVLNQPPNDTLKLREGPIEYFCVAVRGEVSKEISHRMGLVANLINVNRGTVYFLVSGLVIGAYGLFTEESETGQNCSNLWNSLNAELKEDVKMVHVATVGHFGNIGSNDISLFSFIAPGFLDALAVLAALSYGEVRKLEK